MLSDEEKKAINLLKSYENKLVYEISEKDKKAVKILLNLIEKQYKEIEELKNITKSYDSFLGDEKIVIADKKFFVNGYFQENFVRKDKIKAKIEEYRRLLYSYEKDLEEKLHYVDKGSMNCIIAQLQILQSLLEKE